MKKRAARNKPTETRAHILAAGDSSETLSVLDGILANDYTVTQATGAQQALRILRREEISMVIADAFTPTMSGLELLSVLKADGSLSSIPVIMLTDAGNTENEIEALRLGAVDIVRKPIVPQILLARVRNFLALQASFHAMEENLKNQQRLKAQAEALRTVERDELTGVLTRQAFCRHVRVYLDAHPEQKLEIIRFDLDNFSTINDLMGVKAGDRLLREIGQEIANHSDAAAGLLVTGHIEADHFAALHDPAKRSAEELLAYAQTWLAENEAAYRTSARFGVYPIIDSGVDPAVMCDRALLALRSIKGNYSKRVARYDDSMRQKLLEEMRLTEEMLPALDSGQFEVYYQPQVNYSANELIGAEALIRWNHPEKGLLSPAVFLPLFERNGQIVQLDSFVWETVCRQLEAWRRRFGDSVPPVSVNISRMDIYGGDLCSRLSALTDQYGVPRELLRLEITESAYVGDARRLCEVVERLSAAGFTIEMDDFGSDYSSLNMLKDIPVDILKLDMKFLSDTKNSARSGNILSSVVRMARWLKLPTIAEGVETKQQADYLSSIGCLYMQGYFFQGPFRRRNMRLIFRAGRSEERINTAIRTSARRRAFGTPRRRRRLYSTAMSAARSFCSGPVSSWRCCAQTTSSSGSYISRARITCPSCWTSGGAL